MLSTAGVPIVTEKFIVYYEYPGIATLAVAHWYLRPNIYARIILKVSHLYLTLPISSNKCSKQPLARAQAAPKVYIKMLKVINVCHIRLKNSDHYYGDRQLYIYYKQKENTYQWIIINIKMTVSKYLSYTKHKNHIID